MGNARAVFHPTTYLHQRHGVALDRRDCNIITVEDRGRVKQGEILEEPLFTLRHRLCLYARRQ